MLQLIDIHFCGMDLENAQSVADDVLDMRLPVFSFDLVFHKLKNILDVGPKMLRQKFMELRVTCLLSAERPRTRRQAFGKTESGISPASLAHSRRSAGHKI